MVQLTYLVAPIALLSSVLAETHTVAVGPGNTFNPDTLTAAKGDIVEFHFSRTHSVASGSFDSPCKSSGDSAIYSGDMSSGVFSVMVNSTDPIWYYCGYSNHCQDGMVGVINAAGGSIDDYKSASAKTSGSSPPSAVQNGIVGSASSFGSSSGDSSSSSAAASASGSSGSSSSGSTASATSGGSSTTASTAGTSTASTAASSSPNAASSVNAWGLAGLAGALVALAA